ncbi:unnamed protein product [Dibothriocephalus latus]|uniref:Reverse transcriptase domain-containing protein n=1 Tax=Dibothriocephalus latus TaxID=60516 RepID=A0A3P7NX03_DIBLA|nr:unnamed protein product [Dibothriocephalus latus]
MNVGGGKRGTGLLHDRIIILKILEPLTLGRQCLQSGVWALFNFGEQRRPGFSITSVALVPNCYPLSAPAGLFTLLDGNTFFAKFDLVDAHLQVAVAPVSRELLTINIHRALLQYSRLPFGVEIAPVLFQ